MRQQHLNRKSLQLSGHSYQDALTKKPVSSGRGVGVRWAAIAGGGGPYWSGPHFNCNLRARGIGWRATGGVTEDRTPWSRFLLDWHYSCRDPRYYWCGPTVRHQTDSRCIFLRARSGDLGPWTRPALHLGRLVKPRQEATVDSRTARGRRCLLLMGFQLRLGLLLA